MIPKYGCGYFIVNPKYDHTHVKINKSDYDNFTIYISRELKHKLKNLIGLRWKLPNYVKVNNKLYYAYDMFVMDDKTVVAPLFQMNLPNNEL